MEDKDILAMYWERNEQALIETEKKYGKILHRLSENIVKNNEDAEECVNDTYQKAWESIPPTRPNHFLAYLARIARNFSFGKLDYRQAAKRNAEVVSFSQEMEECIPDSVDDDALIESLDIGDCINDFLRMQKAEYRQIFVRRYFYSDSVREISRVYGISSSKVKVILFRMRKALKAHMEKGGIWI